MHPEFLPRLIERLYSTGELLSRCMELPITEPAATSLKFAQFDESSRANGSRLGGVQAYWQSEAATYTTSQPKFSLSEITAHKLIALVYVSNELTDDAASLGQFTTEGFAKEMAFVLDNAIIRGNGAGKPLGILNSPALIKVAKESAQAAGTVVAQNVVNAWARCWAPSRKTAVWITNVETEAQLLTLTIPVGAGGSVIELYQQTDDPDNQPYNLMLGRPVIPVEYCPTTGNVGDLMLCDFSRYILALKEAMETDVSIHVRFVADEQVFRFTMRVGGQTIDRIPVTPLFGTNTQSPFVCIDAR